MVLTLPVDDSRATATQPMPASQPGPNTFYRKHDQRPVRTILRRSKCQAELKHLDWGACVAPVLDNG